MSTPIFMVILALSWIAMLSGIFLFGLASRGLLHWKEDVRSQRQKNWVWVLIPFGLLGFVVALVVGP